MEEFSFKFKKQGARKIGDFDAVDKSEWTLLIKPQIQDVTLFFHYHKMWNVTETPAEFDADNVETKKAVVAQPMWLQSTGFIKDEKFIVTSQKTVHRQTFHEIEKVYVQSLTDLIEVQGYKKDWDNYKLDEPQTPLYFINEKKSQADAQSEALLQKMGASIQMGTANNPPPNPVQKVHKVFKTLKMNNQTVNGPISTTP